MLQVLAGAGLFAMVACGETSEPSLIDIEVSKYAVSLPPVSQVVLTATVTGTALDAPLHWTSSAPGIATVADDGPFGVITGVAEGTATVYAALVANPNIRSEPVTVTIARVPALVSFSVDTAHQQLIVGDSKSFALNPVRAESRVTVSYTFSSNNTAVARVDANTGVIAAVSPGSATVTATANGVGAGLNNTTLNATTQVFVATIQTRPRGNITAGRLSTCALKLSGQAFCWGWNVKGQLGDGTTTDRSGPTAVLGGVSFLEISQGYWHTCALSTDHKAFCWGHGADGRLGHGDTLQRREPTAVLSSETFSLIEAGDGHSCAITPLNRAFCWGSNLHGQLGDGSQINRWMPAPALPTLPPLHSIATANSSTCALAVDGAIHCFGFFLGDPRLPESGGNVYRAMSYGGGGKCALSARGKVACWSENTPGTPRIFREDFVFKSIVESDANIVCGITPSNDAYCWGSGSSGQLGNGATMSPANPTLVSGGHKFTELAAGESHTCGITTGNQVYCWGSNSNGQLGTVGANSLVPQLVPFTR